MKTRARAGVLLLSGVGVFALSSARFENGELTERESLAAGKANDSKSLSQAILNRLSYESKLPGMECSGDEVDWGAAKKLPNLRILQPSVEGIRSCLPGEDGDQFKIVTTNDATVSGATGWKPFIPWGSGWAGIGGKCWEPRSSTRMQVCGAISDHFLSLGSTYSGNEDDWTLNVAPGTAANGEIPFPWPGDTVKDDHHGTAFQAEVEVDGNSGLWHTLGKHLPLEHTSRACVYGVFVTDHCHTGVPPVLWTFPEA